MSTEEAYKVRQRDHVEDIDIFIHDVLVPLWDSGDMNVHLHALFNLRGQPPTAAAIAHVAKWIKSAMEMQADAACTAYAERDESIPPWARADDAKLDEADRHRLECRNAL